jgi:hypothetical protein
MEIPDSGQLIESGVKSTIVAGDVRILLKDM